MWTFWIFISLFIHSFSGIASDSSEEDDVICTPPWEKVHRSCVLFVRSKPFLTWEKARSKCQTMKADLLSISDKNTDNKLGPVLRDHITGHQFIEWWIGIRMVNGTWRWVDNDQPYEKIPEWAPGYGRSVNPVDNSLILNQCGILDHQKYLQSETVCSSDEVTKPFICEQIKLTQPTVPPKSPQVVTEPNQPTALERSPTLEKQVTQPTAPPTSPQIVTVPKQPTAPKLSTTTKKLTTKTSFPVPTPDTASPSTKTAQSHTSVTTRQSTDKPSENSKVTENPLVTPSDKPSETLTSKSSSKSTDTPSEKPPPDRPTDKPTRRPTDKPTRRPTDKPTPKPTDKPTRRPTDKPTRRPTDKPTRRPTGKPTNESSIPEETTPINQKDRNEKEEFQGCYAINYEETCPPVEAFGISWPRSEPGKMVLVPCDKGHAKWKCDKKPVCWRDEPDVKQCTSESIQELTTQMEEFLANTSDPELAVTFTENLAASAESETVMSEQDIYQSTKLMNAASSAKPKNSTDAKNIIKNVAKCGSLLVSEKRKNTWSGMSKESQRTVASALLDSMETVSKKMLKSFSEPTVETIVEENMAIELQVLSVDKDAPDVKDAKFEEGSNQFAIPAENLKQFSTGGLARMVFIAFNNVGEFLAPDDNRADDNTERQLISKVISASLDNKAEEDNLSEPVVFTMATEERAKNQEWKQLCSFWNFSLGYTGAWSSKGCSLKKYNETHTTCQCNHLTNFAILMDIHSTEVAPVHATALSYITYVGIIISIICLFLSWITFVCLSTRRVYERKNDNIRCIRGSRSSSGHGDANEVYGHSGSYTGSTAGTRSAQGERNSIHKNLVFCLFVAEVLFLAGIERTDNKIACSIIAGCLHYFFLSSFTWMFLEGIHILFMLVQVFDGAKSRLRYYYAIGYGAPLLVVGISALVFYEGYGTERYCWLTSERMFIWSFAGPVAFILLVNVVILTYAMTAVCKHSEYVFAKEKSAAGNFKAWIQGALALEVLLGLTWIFGYFYISEEALTMAYLFTIFNSFQGLFIFVFHCLMNKKVRKEYTRFIDYPRRPVSSGTSKGSHHSGSANTASYHINGNKKNNGFVSLHTERRMSSKSTTSA